ncbi:hypothetical protein Pecwa_3761 [Pectobacterium parmentieri WPP163]|nr:hypothetical protein Pecwa_3761 [Pectobacterium parmentieri WPP163]
MFLAIYRALKNFCEQRRNFYAVGIKHLYGIGSLRRGGGV